MLRRVGRGQVDGFLLGPASATAIAAAIVVLPTPPLPMTMTKTVPHGGQLVHERVQIQ